MRAAPRTWTAYTTNRARTPTASTGSNGTTGKAPATHSRPPPWWSDQPTSNRLRSSKKVKRSENFRRSETDTTTQSKQCPAVSCQVVLVQKTEEMPVTFQRQKNIVPERTDNGQRQHLRWMELQTHEGLAGHAFVKINVLRFWRSVSFFPRVALQHLICQIIKTKYFLQTVSAIFLSEAYLFISEHIVNMLISWFYEGFKTQKLTMVQRVKPWAYCSVKTKETNCTETSLVQPSW